MKELELERLCAECRSLVSQTGEFLMKELGTVTKEQIEEKSLNSLVSYVDKTAEEQLVKGLSDLIPGAVFLTEEETVTPQKGEYQWIIDPLDGTTNFLHQLPCFAVSVALYRNGKPLIGIVYEVNRKECFYAWQHGGAFLNGKPITVSKTKTLKDSLIATGFPYQDYSRVKPYFIAFERFMKETRGIRRFGAAAVDLAYVACGRFDAFFEYGLSPWDVAAGVLIVKEAGGQVADFSRGDDFIFGGELVASNCNTFEQVMNVVETAFKTNPIEP